MSDVNNSRIDPRANPLYGIHGPISDIGDSSAQIIGVLDSILSPEANNGTISHIDDDGFTRTFNLHTRVNSDTGETEHIAAETVESSLAHIAYKLNNSNSSSTQNISDEITDYKTNIANQIDDLLSNSELSAINSAEAAIDSTASIDSFDQSIQALQSQLLSLEGQLNGFNNSFDLGIINSISHSLIGGINAPVADQDNLESITLPDGTAVKISNERNLFEVLFGSDGLESDPDRINDPDYLLSLGATDLTAVLSNVAQNNLSQSAKSLLATQFMLASKNNARGDLKKRSIGKDGQAIVSNKPAPVLMSSFTPASAALLGIANRLSNTISSNVNHLVGDGEQAGLLTWKAQTINIAAPGEPIKLVELNMPTGGFVSKFFMPSPVADLDPNDPKDAQLLRDIDSYLQREGLTNGLNLPIADFNEFVQNNSSQIQAQIQTIINENIFQDPQLIQAKAEMHSAQVAFNDFKTNLKNTKAQKDSKTDEITDKKSQKSSLEAALAAARAEASPDQTVIDQLEKDIVNSDQEILDLERELDSINRDMNNLMDQKAGLQSGLENKMLAYSDMLTGKVDDDNGLEDRIQSEAIDDNLDSKIDDLSQNVRNAAIEMTNTITDPDNGVIQSLEDLVNGNLNPELQASEEEMRYLAVLMLLLSTLAAGEWDYNEAEANRYNS